MAENKFIKHLKGEQTAGSLLEIKNQNTPASFGNMPQGTSDSNVKYADVRGDVTVVANGTMAWKINDSALTLAPIVNGDGTDYISNYAVSGAGLWVNSTYTFPSTGDPNHPVAMIFNPNTKWVLKLCGDNLIVNNGETLELTVVITIGSSNIISKQFTVREQATHFCKELVIDFDESNSALIKASGLSTMQLQVLCGTADASARIYNGMTTLTVLQRKVDAAVVSGTFANVEEVLRDGILPSDYFNNAAYIAQIEDGDSAYAVFTRDGDTVALSGWAQPIPDQTNNAGKFLTTDGSLMSWEELTISNVSGLQDELDDLQDQITINKGTMDTHIADTNNPHQVTKAQVGLSNVDNTSDLDKPISTATQAALDLKMPISTKYGASISLTIDSSTYVVTAQLKDQDNNNLGTAQTIDLPLESVVVSGSYDSATKEVILVLENGSEIRFSVADLISGLQSEITAQNPLDADLVNDSTSVHKFVTSAEKTTWNNKQNAISDLATIRSNAQAGKAASDTIATYGNIVTHNVSEFATAAQGAKADTAVQPSDLATVATTGDYDDLLNKPTIPAAQVNSDWNANSGVAQILNKPTIPTVNNSTITITQGGVTKGSFTLNQASGDTIDLDAGGGSGSGYHPDLFDVKWADHICNDVQWLRADTFSWQSGSVYQVAYQHLADDIDGKTLQSETISGTTIQFYLADDGHKICPASEESNVSAIYNATGVAWYYIIDTANTRFKLPRRHSQKIVRSVKNADGSWYRLYADGWVEQGGRLTQTGTATLPVQMLDANYDLQVRLDYNSTGTIQGRYWYATKTTTDFTMGVFQTTIPIDWQVSGQSTIDMSSFQNGEKYLYFYVGNFTQTALENTAGLNAELFNGKADLNLANVLANIDFVVESQLPTAENNYTWYRKYKSGWIEQGGVLSQTGGIRSVSFPVEMADTNYVLIRVQNQSNGIQSNYPGWTSGTESRTTTGFTYNATATSVWQVSGMAAN